MIMFFLAKSRDKKFTGRRQETFTLHYTAQHSGYKCSDFQSLNILLCSFLEPTRTPQSQSQHTCCHSTSVLTSNSYGIFSLFVVHYPLHSQSKFYQNYIRLFTVESQQMILSKNTWILQPTSLSRIMASIKDQTCSMLTNTNISCY